jgi:choline-sulfatase
MWTVIREGGPFHTRGLLHAYADRLRDSGRDAAADRLLAGHEETAWEAPIQR